MRRTYIVRHGNTFAPGEPPRRIGARTDIPLVESGRAQAIALRDHFHKRGIAFDRVLVSPLLRTRETAALIARDVPVEPTDWLCEIDHGPDEDATEADVIARIGPEALAAWEGRAEPPPGWIVDAPARTAAWRAFFDRPSDRPATKTTLLVTSNGAARFARIALGMPPAKLRTGAYGIVEWRDELPVLTAWDVRG